MNLDRLEVLAMISFLKHVIPESEDTGKNCLFARCEEDRVIFTGGSEYAAKKVVLVRHMDMEDAAGTKKKPPKTFMIPKATIESFATLLKKHAKKCKKLAKSDPSHLYIDITHENLTSHNTILRYQQPSYQFKDMEQLFTKKQSAISNMFLLPGDIEAVVKGFNKSKQVEQTFSGDGEPVHFLQPSNEYEAIYIPPPEEEKPPMSGDND